MRVRFGDVELDSDSRQVLRDGREVHLSTKAFDLLVLLLTRRPDAIAKAEIHKHLWQDTFVSETNLPTLVAEIRHAIGDDAKRPLYLRTLHGIGYAFQADAMSVARQASDATAVAWLLGAGLHVVLCRGENVLGRDGPDVIALESPTVSRRHARLTIDGRGEVTAEDLGSKNGTFVNDHPLAGPTPVVDGDLVRIGSLVLTFRLARPVTSTQTV